MPYTLDESGALVWADETPDRVAPAAKPVADPNASTIRPELEQGPAERTVQLIDPSGHVFDVGESGARTALESGRYKLATPEQVSRWDTRAERDTAVESLKAFGEGAGAAVLDVAAGTGNLLNAVKGEESYERLRKEGAVTGRELQALVVAGPDEQAQKDYEAAARLRAEEHGVASGAGTFAGTALTAAIPGGVASRGAAALGASRALATGIAGAAEGAAIGYTQASEEAFFENRELTGEQVLAGMGWNAVIGGGIGYGLGKVGGVLFSRSGSRGATPFDSPRAPRELLPPGETGSLAPLRAKAQEARRAADEAAAGLEKLPAGSGKKAAREAAEASATGAREAAESAEMALREAESAAAKAPSAGSPFGERFAETLRGYSEERVTKALGARGTDIRKLGRTAPKAETEMRRMARDVLEGKLEDGTPIFRAVQSQEELVGNLVRAREEAGSSLGAFRERIGSYIDERAKDLRPRPGVIADRIENEVITGLEQSPIPQVRAKARAVRGVVEGIRNMGEDVSLAEMTRAKQELASIIYPKAPGPGLPPAPPLAALELQKAERILEESIEATIDKAATKMGGAELGRYAELKAKFRSYREAAQIAGKAQLQELGNRVVSPSDYGVGAVGGAIFGGGPFGAAVTGAATAAIHKTIREHSSAVLAVLADRLAKRVDRRVSKGLDAFFDRALGQASHTRPANDTARAVRRVSATTGQPLPPASAAVATPMALFLAKDTDKQVAYRKRAKEILEANAEYGTRVRARVEESLGGLASQAPKLAASMATTATKGAQFLASKLPAPIVNSRSLTPSRALPVSDLEIEKFSKYWAAVANPTSVVDELKIGRLVPEQVEALQAVYPEFYRSIVQKVQERLGELDQKGTFVPYRARLELDLLLKMNGAGEPTARPDRVQLFQEVRAMAPQLEAENRPQPPPKPVNIASHLRSGRDAFDPGASP